MGRRGMCIIIQILVWLRFLREVTDRVRKKEES